jgi:Zn-dependent peptidase ImmA (M78 family)/transcriptional regulator with XRE-family HTH domain
MNSSKSQFVPQRLELARTLSGLTLKELAEQVYVSKGLLSFLENGKKSPSAEVIAALAQALNVRPDFFFLPVSDSWTEAQCSFRHRTTTPESLKRRARAYGSMLSEVIETLKVLGVRFPAYQVPRVTVRSIHDVEAAADRCRLEWGYGTSAPLPQLGRVVEHHGVVLVKHPAWSQKVDAFSRRGHASIIALSTARTSVSRWLFDIAHELGHLVMHETATGSPQQEYEANWFGGAFMLPKRAFTREFTSRPFSWSHVFQLKQRWGASAAAIVRRAFNLELIDAITYRQCCKGISAHGWTRAEPHEPDQQLVAPELLPMAFSELGRVGCAPAQIAERLAISPGLFAELTGIDITPADSARHQSNVVAFTDR